MIPLWLTALAAGAAGILSGMGIGSAGLFVLYLTLVLRMDQVTAQGLNLVFFLASAGGSVLLSHKRSDIPARVVVLLVISALPGAALGTYLTGVLNRALIRRLFGCMLTVTGGMALVGAGRKSEA